MEHAAARDRITVGVAGWSYPDWDGYVYDRGVKDKLRFIAEHFDMVEVNSTFYRPPTPRTVESWVRRTADLPAFFFTAKIHQDVTHRGRAESGMVDAFHTAFAPMRDAGKLKHLLAQFRWDFADAPEERTHLKRIQERFGDLANITYELRHSSWQSFDALEFLSSLGGSVANLDYPLARNSFNLDTCTVGDHAYLRLHGRNSKAWFSKSGRDETYNYLYSADETDAIAGRAVRISELSKSLTLVANNHYQGKEAVNALELRFKITGEKVRVPPQLLKRYPRLENIANNPPQRELL